MDNERTRLDLNQGFGRMRHGMRIKKGIDERFGLGGGCRQVHSRVVEGQCETLRAAESG